MYIMNGNGTELVNVEYVERFRAIQQTDCALVIASYGEARRAVTLAKYQTLDDAMASLAGLHKAIAEQDVEYYMVPNSGYYAPERPRHGYHGRKLNGHGSS